MGARGGSSADASEHSAYAARFYGRGWGSSFRPPSPFHVIIMGKQTYFCGGVTAVTARRSQSSWVQLSQTSRVNVALLTVKFVWATIIRNDIGPQLSGPVCSQRVCPQTSLSKATRELWLACSLLVARWSAALLPVAQLSALPASAQIQQTA